MRLGLLGDVHAEDAALAAALARLAGDGAERVLCVGDLVDGPGDANAAIALLRDAGALCVRGNHERWLIDHQMRDLPEATDPRALTEASWEYLLGLPPTLELETPRGRLLLGHGLGDDDMARLLPDDYGYALQSNEALQSLVASGRHAFAVGGHTHRRLARRFGGLWVLNPGTLYRAHQPGFALLDLAASELRWYRLASGEARPDGAVPLA